MASIEGQQEICLDEAFRILDDPKRIRLLSALTKLGAQQELSVPGDLREFGEDLERLKVEFHHHHLPKLREFDIITWDRDAGTVGKGANFGDIQRMLEQFDQEQLKPLEEQA